VPHLFAVQDSACNGFLSALRLLKASGFPFKYLNVKDIVVSAFFDPNDRNVFDFLKRWKREYLDAVADVPPKTLELFQNLPTYLPTFDLNTLILGGLCLCIGPSECGKTGLSIRLLHVFMAHADHIVLVGRTVGNLRLPASKSVQRFTYDWDNTEEEETEVEVYLQRVVDEQRHTQTRRNHVVILVNRCSANMLKTSVMRGIIMNSRHLNITLIVTATSFQFSPNIRSNARYIFASVTGCSDKPLKVLYENFFGYYNTFKLFKEDIKGVEDHQFIVSDQTLLKPTIFIC